MSEITLLRKLDLLIADDSNSNEFINKVYTSSRHANAAKQILNHLAEADSRWKTTLMFLAGYPMYKWAKASRNHIGIDFTTLNELILEGNTDSEYFGISSEKIKRIQRDMLYASDEIVNIIEDSLKSDIYNLGNGFSAYKAIHDANAEDVSKHIFGKYYESAVIKICKLISGKINKIYKNVEKSIKDIDLDIRLVFHDVDLLLSIGNDIKHSAYRNERLLQNGLRKIYRQIDGFDVYDTIWECLKSLHDYPFNGPILYKVMSKTFIGEPEEKIADEIGKSRTYLRAKKTEGTKALGCLIWGIGDVSTFR